MSKVPREAIHASVFKYIQDNIADRVYQGVADYIDPTDSNLTQWMEVTIANIVDTDSRESCREADLTVRVCCYSKSQTDLYKALELADDILDLLHQTRVINVTDYSVSDPAVVGHIRFLPAKSRPVSKQVWNGYETDIAGRYYGVEL